MSSYKSSSSGGSSASKKAKSSKELYQENIDIIKDPLENEVCLGCDDYEFKDGTLIIRDNTTLIIPLGTTLKITDK